MARNSGYTGYAVVTEVVTKYSLYIKGFFNGNRSVTGVTTKERFSRGEIRVGRTRGLCATRISSLRRKAVVTRVTLVTPTEKWLCDGENRLEVCNRSTKSGGYGLVTSHGFAFRGTRLPLVPLSKALRLRWVLSRMRGGRG